MTRKLTKEHRVLLRQGTDAAQSYYKDSDADTLISIGSMYDLLDDLDTADTEIAMFSRMALNEKNLNDELIKERDDALAKLEVVRRSLRLIHSDTNFDNSGHGYLSMINGVCALAREALAKLEEPK